MAPAGQSHGREARRRTDEGAQTQEKGSDRRTGFLGPPMGAVTVKARESSSSEEGRLLRGQTHRGEADTQRGAAPGQAQGRGEAARRRTKRSPPASPSLVPGRGSHVHAEASQAGRSGKKGARLPVERPVQPLGQLLAHEGRGALAKGSAHAARAAGLGQRSRGMHRVGEPTQRPSLWLGRHGPNLAREGHPVLHQTHGKPTSPWRASGHVRAEGPQLRTEA